MFTPVMWGLLLAGLAAAAVWAAMVAIPNEYDSCIFLWMGRRMWHGDVPYRDLWDNKLPLLYWLNAVAGASSHPTWVLYALGSLAVSAGGWGVYAIGRRLMGEWPGRLAGLAYVTLAGGPRMLMTGNLTENWAAPLVVLSVWAMLRYAADARLSVSWAVVSGLGMGAATCLRQPALLVGAVLLVMTPALWRARRLTAVAVMAWLIGFLLVPLLMLAWARAVGVLDLMIDQCIRFNMVYGAGGGTRPAWATWGVVGRRLGELMLDTWPWHLAALTGVGVLLARKGGAFRFRVSPAVTESQRRGPGARWVTLVWLVAAIVSALPSLRFYTHHYYLALAPLSLSAGAVWLAFAGPNRPDARRIGWAVAALLAVGVLFHFDEVWVNAGDYARPAAEPVRQAAAYVSGHARPGQSLYLFAWGKESDILPRTAMKSPTKHVMAIFYSELHSGQKMLGEWRDDLLANPPDWLVCREDMDLVSDPRPSQPRWSSRFDWDRPEVNQYADEVWLSYRSLYEPVASFRRGRATTRPDPDRLIVYRRRG